VNPYREPPEPPPPYDKFPVFRKLIVTLWLFVLGYTTLLGVFRGLIDGAWWGLSVPLHWLATAPIFVILLWVVKKKRLLV
jgi:hypothetical protein